MTSLKHLLLTGSLGLALAASAHALSYTQSHLGGAFEYEYLQKDDTYANTFSLGLADNEYVSWAKLSFAFADDSLLGDTHFKIGRKTVWLGDDYEWVDITAGSVNGTWEVEGNIFWYHWIWFADEEGDGGIVDSMNNHPNKGTLEYFVNATQGDFYLKEVVLCATTYFEDTPPPAVPDSASTAALLGLALIGLARFRRR